MIKENVEEARCDGCFGFKDLKLSCLCMDVSYCTLDCFKWDITHHKLTCEADIGSKPEFLSNFEKFFQNS